MMEAEDNTNYPAYWQQKWYILREDQNNVVLDTADDVQQVQNGELRYLMDTGDNKYIEITEPADIVHETIEIDGTEQAVKEEEIFWVREKIKLLLTQVVAEKEKNPNCINDRTVWSEIAPLLGVTPEDCFKKYNNLKNTYIRLFKKKRLGKDIKWVHYNLCEVAFKDCELLPPTLLEAWEDSKIRKLLTLYIENIERFRDPNILHQDIWKEIAAVLGTSAYNTYKKYRTLKRTYIKSMDRNRGTGKLIKWPYCEYFEQILHTIGPGRWDNNKIKTLLAAYAQRAHKFVSPKFRKIDLWKELSDVVGQTPNDCDKKFRNLKQTYSKLKSWQESGKTITKWRFFEDFEFIYNNNPSSTNDGVESAEIEEDYIDHMLNYYIENLDKFNSPLVKNKYLWRTFAVKHGLTWVACDRKFRNLKQTYLRLVERRQRTGKRTNWPYFKYFETIYSGTKTATPGIENIEVDTEDVILNEIKKVVNDVTDHKGGDRKFERLIKVVEESNEIQKERNRILLALLDRNYPI